MPREKVGEREESEGVLTAGKSEDGEGSGTAVRAEVRTADRRSSSVRRLQPPWRERESEIERGQQGSARGLGSFKSRPRSGGRSHDARRGRRLQLRQARAGGSEPRGRKGTAPTGGARASAAGERGGAAVVAMLGRRRCWAA